MFSVLLANGILYNGFAQEAHAIEAALRYSLDHYVMLGTTLPEAWIMDHWGIVGVVRRGLFTRWR